MPKGIRKTENVEENTRPKRVPLFDQARNILTVAGKRPGFEYRWFNDIDTRIDNAKFGGWQHVTYEELAQIGERTVDESRHSPKDLVAHKVGNAVTAYLMCIPSEYYNEDQKAKQAHIDEMEAQMYAQAENANFYGNIKTGQG